jgi:hypothetical protein
MIAQRVHRLVVNAFLGDSKLQVNHKDGNKQNNRLDNLELLESRDNCVHFHKSKPKTSTYIGVSKRKNKYVAFFYENGKNNYLGTFDNEIDASNAYQNALKKRNIELKYL